MGSCLSTKNPPKTHHFSNQPKPAPLEEEKVKEVLSETPNFKPRIKINPTFPIVDQVEDDDKLSKRGLKSLEEKVGITIESKVEVSSEVSEIWSCSESVSTTTITDGEVRRRIDKSPAKFKSFSGDLSVKRDRVVVRSPARSLNPSPARRNDVSGKRSSWNDSQRRYSGETGSQRSRSPATRMEGCVPRSGSSRRTAISPGRVRVVGQPETARKIENKWLPPPQLPTTTESLDNPLVSLECFIFL